MSKISGQFQDICEISGISGQLGALNYVECLAHQNSIKYSLKTRHTMPPEATAMSRSVFLRLSPKPGAFTAQTWRPTLILTNTICTLHAAVQRMQPSAGRQQTNICYTMATQSHIHDMTFVVCVWLFVPSSTDMVLQRNQAWPQQSPLLKVLLSFFMIDNID